MNAKKWDWGAVVGCALVVAIVSSAFIGMWLKDANRPEYSLFGDREGTTAVIVIAEDGTSFDVKHGLGDISREVLDEIYKRMDENRDQHD